MDLNLAISFGPVVAVGVYGLITLAILFAKNFVVAGLDMENLVENRGASVFVGKKIRIWWIYTISPIVRTFKAIGVTPNQVSFLGTVLSLLAGLTFAYSRGWIDIGAYALGGWLMAFGGSLDFVDGSLARMTNNCTVSGAFFDSILDRYAEALVYLGLAWMYRHSLGLWLVLAAFYGSLMTSYMRAHGEKLGAKYKKGIMQRPERIVYLSVAGIFTPTLAYAAQNFWPEMSLQVLAFRIYMIPIAVVAIFSNWTALQRFYGIYHELKAAHDQK